MKIVRWLLPLLAFLIAGVAFANTETSVGQAIPSLSGAVVDTTKWLNQQETLALEAKIKDVRTATKAQIAVLIVDTVKPEAIEQYSLRVAEQWKIGKKGEDTGAIILIARSDRKIRIEVGYGLEGQLTDLSSKKIINEKIAPRLKENKPYDALSGGIDEIMILLLKEAPKAASAASSPTSIEEKVEEFAIPYFDELNSAGKVVAIVLGVIGGILLLAGVYGEEGMAVLFGLFVPIVGGMVIGLLVNITHCFLVAIVAFIVALVIALGITIGGAVVSGGTFGGGGASGDF